MIDFSNVKSIVIPEGEAIQIARGAEILWRKQKYKCEVEYLESTGTQYMKTGITTTGNTRVVAKMMALATGSAGQYVYLCSSASNLFSVRIHWSTRRAYGTYGSTSSIIFYDGFVGDVLDINFGSGKAGVNTHEIDMPYVEFSDGELQILAKNGGSFCDGRVWYFQVYDGETLVRDFIPVLDWNDRPCMYDKVTDELFYNQGTGEFLYGE